MTAVAQRLAEIRERHIDDALLALSRARDSYRGEGRHLSADRLCDAIAFTEAAFREGAR